MTAQSLAVLQAALAKHAPLSSARLETLALRITGMLGARTVNLGHMASERVAPAKHASTFRRFQRFFKEVALSPAPGEVGGVGLGRDWAARLIVSLLRLSSPWPLCLDRTHWKIGRREVNVLVLAVVTRRHRVPLMWTLLGRAGNSATAERIALMERYLARFEAKSIKHLLADREFIGVDWFEYLDDSDIPFAIRVRANQRVLTEGGERVALGRLLRTCRGGGRLMRIGFERDGDTDPLWLGAKARRIRGGELLIIVANRNAHHALAAYRRRWGIECLFAEAKTRGLNIEDTRLGNNERIGLLLAVVALAMAWASRIAYVEIGNRAPPRLSHGYPARSWFRLGLDRLRQLLRSDPAEAVKPWQNTPKAAGVV